MKLPHTLAMTALAVTLALGEVAPLRADDATQMNAIEYEIAVQRAAEAAIWAMPAVSVWDIALSTQRDLGGDIGDIVYFTQPMTSRHGFLTAPTTSPTFRTSPPSSTTNPF